MALESGARLGPYEILAPLGQGGMGQVYRARDTRLDRIVAIKILPAHIAGDPERRERFQREARVVSRLNHPHICVLYDVGQQTTPEGLLDYLVIEHLDGESLAARLTRGPLGMDQVLRYAAEIADALDAAHRQGIVHRDLKPGNIVLTKTGAKLLDFGLAKVGAAVAAGGGSLGHSSSSGLSTRDQPLTAQGTILGTLPYMAPEQLEGRETDARTDIFALGAVIYEMATGKKPFEGRSQASLVAVILERDPAPLSALQPTASPALERVVTTCLAKSPDDRFQTAHDLLLALRWIIEGVSQSGVSAAVVLRSRRMRLAQLGWIVAAVTGAVAVLAIIGLLRAPTAGRGTVSRFILPITPATELRGSFALSPDGTRLAFVGRVEGKTQIYLRAMDQLEAAPLPGTENAGHAFFSPDGQWLGFAADGKLKRLPLEGGAPLTICEAPPGSDAVWAPGDVIFFNSGATLARVSSSGGTPEPVTTLGSSGEELSHRWPDVLPGGRAILFSVRSKSRPSFDDAAIAVQSLETGERRLLIQGGTHPRYLPTGHIVYAQGGNLLAVAFDAKRLAVLGRPVPVVERVYVELSSGWASFAVSRDGMLVYLEGHGGRLDNRLVWVEREGKAAPLSASPRAYADPRLSPDGRRLALHIPDGDDDVWILEMDRETLTRFTFEAGEDETPVWSPDGRWIAFSSSRAGQPRSVFRKRADGSGAEELLWQTEHHVHLGDWSSDGRTIVLAQLSQESRSDIWALDVDEKIARPLLTGAFEQEQPRLSPDGRWLAYKSNESGRSEVYVRRFPELGEKWQVSTAGGTQPVWSSTGRGLYYRGTDQLMSVVVSSETLFVASRPRALFEDRFASPQGSGHTGYDAAEDGRRFLMVQGAPAGLRQTELAVIQDWFTELTRRVPSSP